MRESRVLRAAKRAAKRNGLRALRLHFGPGAEAGWPDLLIVGPNGCVMWMETKAPGGKTRPIQDERIALLRGMGHDTAVPDTPERAVAEIEDFAEMCGENASGW